MGSDVQGWYSILSLTYGVEYSDQEGRSAYRRASMRAHPDKPGGSDEQFGQVTRALEFLATQARRDAYKTLNGLIERNKRDDWLG
jgi:curved DNA-binding protein CbpA